MSTYNTGGVVSLDSNLFSQEYTCQWGKPDDCDHPIYTMEKDNKMILLYELIGLSGDSVTAKVEFINKAKQTYLNIKGEYKDELTGWENDINIHLFIDTNIYDTYNWSIKNGILTVILHEIANERPKFDKSVNII